MQLILLVGEQNVHYIIWREHKGYCLPCFLEFYLERDFWYLEKITEFVLKLTMCLGLAYHKSDCLTIKHCNEAQTVTNMHHKIMCIYIYIYIYI